MRADDCSTQLWAKLAIQTPEGDNVILTAFLDTLTATTVKNIPSLSDTEVAEVLLLMDNVTLNYNRNRMIVTELSVT